VFGTEIAELLYTEADAYWGKVLAILMLTFVIRSTDYVFGSLLTAYERLSFMNRIFGWAVLINVGMNFWLIPTYQAEGAAYATLISQAFVVVIFFWAAHRYILQTGLWGALAKGILFAVLCLLSVGLIRQLEGSWMFQVLLILLASGILSVLLGMVQPLFAWIRIGKKE
jgi:O-antigen/teichoic acid export membrane protein